MSSFMSRFAAFAIKSSGWKKKVTNPDSREKFIAKLRKLCDKFVIYPIPEARQAQDEIIELLNS